MSFVALQHKYQVDLGEKMSEKIAKLLERLAEMFPNSSYQSKLERYLKTKNITDAGQLEAYIRQYETRQEYFQ